jgi:hypothetical protein
MDPSRRLLFWLRVPFLADAALAVIGVLFLVSGRGMAGWGVLIFAAVRAIVGVIALFVLAPRLLRGRATDERPSKKERPR